MTTKKKKESSDNLLLRLYKLGVVVISIAAYTIGATLWLQAQGVVLITALGTTLGVGLFLTGMVFLAIRLRRAEKKSEPNTPSSEKVEADEGDAQKKFRQEARIEGMKHETRKVHDRIFQMGAIIGVILILFALLMRVAFGLSPEEVYFVAWPIVGLIWFLQIAFFPKWATWISFLTFCGLRLGMQMFGPSVLMYLPQFLMLPVFYLLMMVFMFGSIMIPNLMQVKYFRPGQGNWETPVGSTRGQFQARAMIETQIDRFVRYAKGQSNRKPTRGIVFEGPPGTGKTLLAKEIATKLELPFVLSDASAFNAPFMGFGQLIPLIVRAITEALAREFGGAIFFIDEGENLFGARSGMQQQQMPANRREVDLWDVWDMGGDQVFDVPYVRTRNWNELQMAEAAKQAPPSGGKHSIFMMPGAMGGSSAIYPFLTWMSGADSAPLMQRLVRSYVNLLLDALFVPVTIGKGQNKKVLRLPPGKPVESNVMFITATNRFWMFDPAMIRPGRFGVVAHFVEPDEDERTDVAGHYLKQWFKQGYYQPDLIRPERIREFAQAIPNTSPAEIEQIIQEAVDVRVQFVAELRRLKGYADRGEMKTLLEGDQKFWLRSKSLVYDTEGKEIPGWDDERVDWHALMESSSQISFGRAAPDAASESTRRKVAFHELGHFLALKLFNGKNQKPTLLSVIARRGSLGMVVHIPYDTKEMFPQSYYEGLIRTSIASWVTEHFFFGENMPGVSQDLRNATSVACLMVGKWGMREFHCAEEDMKYYAGIGEALISEPETSMFNPMANALLESVLKNPKTRAHVARVIGIAVVDAYRLIRNHQRLFLEIIPEFLAIDEFAGNRLTELWSSLDTRLVPFVQMSSEDQQARPPQAFAVVNPFYGGTPAEGEVIYKQVVALTTEGAQ